MTGYAGRWIFLFIFTLFCSALFPALDKRHKIKSRGQNIVLFHSAVFFSSGGFCKGEIWNKGLSLKAAASFGTGQEPGAQTEDASALQGLEVTAAVGTVPRDTVLHHPPSWITTHPVPAAGDHGFICKRSSSSHPFYRLFPVSPPQSWEIISCLSPDTFYFHIRLSWCVHCQCCWRRYVNTCPSCLLLSFDVWADVY